MEWTNAIRKHAEMTGGKYRIPKKGSEEYAAVKALQMGSAAGAAAAPKAASKAAPKAKKVVTDASTSIRTVAEKAKLLKAAKAAKAVKAPTAVDADADASAPAAQSKAVPAKTKRVVANPNQVAAEQVRLRKVRSDKGVKRGARKPKEEEVVEG